MTTSMRHLYPVLGESLRRSRLLSKVIGLSAVKLKKQICMRSAIFNVLAIVLASLMSFARLSIENPKHVNIFPEEQARLLLRLSCRAVAHELHLPRVVHLGNGYALDPRREGRGIRIR